LRFPGRALWPALVAGSAGEDIKLLLDAHWMISLARAKQSPQRLVGSSAASPPASSASIPSDGATVRLTGVGRFLVFPASGAFGALRATGGLQQSGDATPEAGQSNL